MKPFQYDEQLIEQFLTGHKEDAESAFEALVKRHGPLVRGVCRDVLGREQDAEDACDLLRARLCRRSWAHDEVQHRWR